MRLDREDREHIENGELILNNFQKSVDNKKEECYNKGAIVEDIEKHDELNPKLWQDNKLKPEVREKMLEIVDDFTDGLKEDGIDIDISDIVFLGSNCNYNYTKDSDVDLHIIANPENFDCPFNLYPLLYSAYRSLWNKKIDPNFYGIPVELFVEIEGENDTKSNGIYSVLNDEWIKEPVQQDIPEINREEFNDMFKEWEERYLKIIDSEDLEEEAMDAAKDLMKSNMNKQDDAYVGCFWYDPKKKDLYGVVQSRAEDTPFYKSSQWDKEIRTGNALHQNVWKKESMRGKDKRFSGDYKQKPRGRVFEFKDDGFKICVGDWIDKYPEAIKEIVDVFNLPENTEVIKDEHWNIGHGWSQEF